MNRWFYYKQWSHHRLRKWLVHPICRRLYRDMHPDTDRSTLVAGAGRSGTTWVGRIISSQIPCRVMFEPFHSRYVTEFSRFNYFQYMPPESSDAALHAYCWRVFSGRIRHPWIDREVATILPRYRVIKAIRANLFLKWIHNHFSEVRHLFVVRHPCAVVLSRMKLGWATDGDIEPFLSQEALVNDFLADKMDLIQNARTPEEKHAIVWCISHLIPFKCFASGELNLIFYENLCVQPEVELTRIFRAVGYRYKKTVFTALDRPSATATRSSAVMRGDDKIAQWKKSLSSKQISNILSIVEAFGLDCVYDDSLLPLSDEQVIFPPAKGFSPV